MTPEEVVREFCAAVSKRDPEALRPLLGERVTYQNVGTGTSHGREETMENVAGQWAMFPEAYDFERQPRRLGTGCTDRAHRPRWSRRRRSRRARTPDGPLRGPRWPDHRLV
jgi:SnoaL-like domain